MVGHVKIIAMTTGLLRWMQGLALVPVAGVAVANDSHMPGMNHHSAGASDQKPFGAAGDKRDVGRTIRLRMIDEMRFVPDKIKVREGETVHIVLTNNGKLMDRPREAQGS